MSFDKLATELLLQVFCSCSSIADVLNLALTCRRLYRIFSGSRKLPILAHAAETEYGPLREIIQLVTQNASQPAHIIRKAPISIPLLQQVIEVGRVAKKWEEIYPVKKWKLDFENRRLLNAGERFCLRRAIYRLWLYSRAFHSQRFPRTSRVLPAVVIERSQLLHNWSTSELAEIEDVRLVIRDVVRNHLCPSNGTIRRKFYKRYPENTQLLSFNIHLNYPPPPPPSCNFAFSVPQTKPSHSYTSSDSYFHTAHAPTSGSAPVDNKYVTKFRSDLYHDPGVEGWGDEVLHYYVVEDMLKLDPGQIMWLRENAPLKEQVEGYVRSLGDWFDNNGETFAQTLERVIDDRGEDMSGFREAIGDGEMGVALAR
jgi:hypothetical protein